MTFFNNKMQRNFVWLPIVGMLVFVIFYVIAIMQYSGGSYVYPNQAGFNFKTNYLCDLLNVQTINGLQNTARTYARLALATLCFSLILLWIYLPKLFTVKSKAQKIMRTAGILAMTITLFLASDVHDIVLRIAGVFGTIALIIAIVELYIDRYTLLFVLGIICLILFLTNYYIYETELLLDTLPLIQKITFIFCIFWFMLLNRALYKKLHRRL
ncbi:hypothetical protein [Thalassobellus suaedae]|uniref:DUF998 domain-containing protein n=1 Tax=Thalassobellus suaedae TaxID=3074124 RepID=A0ABY9XX56_9FLAO|nr:hypothetical protein RHP51_06470 [Flavobacteriaceae bacterium HL-DH14]